MRGVMWHVTRAVTWVADRVIWFAAPWRELAELEVRVFRLERKVVWLEEKVIELRTNRYGEP